MHDDDLERDDRELARNSKASGDGAPVITKAEALLELLLRNPTRCAVAYPMHDAGADARDRGRLAVCKFSDDDFTAAWRSTILAWIAEDCPARSMIDIAAEDGIAVFGRGEKLYHDWLSDTWRLHPSHREPRPPRGASLPPWHYPPRLH